MDIPQRIAIQLMEIWTETPRRLHEDLGCGCRRHAHTSPIEPLQCHETGKHPKQQTISNNFHLKTIHTTGRAGSILKSLSVCECVRLDATEVLMSVGLAATVFFRATIWKTK